MATETMTMASFEETIGNNDVVMIDFWASWCGPCRSFAPIYEAVSEKHSGIVFAKVDTEAEQDLAAAFGIRAIPTLAVFREGILVFRQPGMLPPEVLEQLIQQVLELDMDDVRAQIAAEKAGDSAD